MVEKFLASLPCGYLPTAFFQVLDAGAKEAFVAASLLTEPRENEEGTYKPIKWLILKRKRGGIFVQLYFIPWGSQFIPIPSTHCISVHVPAGGGS